MIRNFILCFVLLLGAISYAQFSIVLVPTTETCFGNGAIAVTVGNALPGATVDYTLYKMPDESTAIAVGVVGVSGAPDYLHTFTGLASGDYKVVATQSVGTPQGSVIGDTTVDFGGNHVTPIAIIVDKGIKCGEDGFIEITLNQGSAQYFSLFKEDPAGSNTFVPVAGMQQVGGGQNHIFENLEAGHYRIMIRDAICDNNVPYTVFIDPLVIPTPEAGAPEFTPIMTDCDTASVKIEQQLQIPLVAFPVNITITVTPPAGVAFDPDIHIIELLDVQPSGADDPNVVGLEELIPYHIGAYHYTITVTNDCSWWSWVSDPYPVEYYLEVNGRLSEKVCYGIDILVANARGSYTVQFLDRDMWLTGVEVPVSSGHISTFPISSFDNVDALVHSYSPRHPNDTYDYDNPPYIFTLGHNGTTSDVFPVNEEGGSGELTYAIHDMYWLDSTTPYISVDESDVEYDEITGRLVVKNSNPPEKVYISIDEVTGDTIYLVPNYIYVKLDTDGVSWIIATEIDGERVPVLVGEYVIKVTDECGVFGIIDTLGISDEIAEPNITMIPMPTLPNSGDSFLDCIPVGDVYISHQLFFDWGEDQGSDHLTPKVGKVEIIDGPSDYKYYLANYAGVTLPIDITDKVGLSVREQQLQGMQPAPPFPTEVVYPDPTGPGMPRPLFPGLVGIHDDDGNDGIYWFRLTDICGNSWELPAELKPYIDLTSPSAFDVSVAEMCDGPDGEKVGSVQIAATFNETIGAPVYTLVDEAPQAFIDEYTTWWWNPLYGQIDLVNDTYIDVATTPVLGFWYYVPGPQPGDPGYWYFRIGDLPKGTYKFNVKIGCAETVLEFIIEGYEQHPTAPLPMEEGVFELKKYCGNYSLFFDYTSNVSEDFDPPYSLQYCSGTDYESCDDADWVTVNTGLVPGEWFNGITGNNGIYRIVKEVAYFAGPNSIGTCEVVVHWYEYNEIAEIESIDVLSCPGGQSITIVNAVGVEPLTYQLVTVELDENGNIVPGSMVVILDNGHSNIFTDLEPGVHWFNIIDDCGGTVPGAASVGEPVEFEVVEDNLCDGVEDALCHGSDGCLSLVNISILEYTWYKLDSNGNEVPVLDENGNQVTGNRLPFEPFDCIEHTGIYRVRLNVAGGNNLDFCSVDYIEYDLTCGGQPNAGDDTDRIYCHSDQSIDLAELLSAGATSGGTWTDVDGTGALNGSIFDTTGVALGTYVFHYEVGGCNGYDDSFITINLLDTPELPVAASVCEGEMLSIDTPNSAFTYTWTAPDGTTSTGVSIVAQIAGNYMVTATLTGSDCVSPAATVVVKQNPNFTITSITEICTTLTVAGSNFNASEATYVWTFGGNVVGTNVTYVAEEDGEYTVEVTLDGCTSSQTVTVQAPAVAVDYGCVENQFMVFVTNTESFPNATYDWTGPGYSNTGSSINISGLENGVYTVTVTDTDGCTTTGNVTITGTQCMIPKGVSPNGDDINDTFNLSNFNVREVKIFNRYGRTVYEKANGYTNEWYGQSSDDKMLPSATYYYLVTLIDGTQKSGWVYLNRED